MLLTGTWPPYPSVDDREAWERIPAASRDAWVAKGEAALALPWPEIPATAWLDYVRTGQRGAFDLPHFTRRVILRDLVLAECFEDEGRFVEAAMDAAWSMCEESSWTWPACLYMQSEGEGLPDPEERVVDLGAAENGAHMAWTRHLLGAKFDLVSPLVNARIEREVRRHVLDPYLARDDFWWMSAVNNWHPWIHSNVLACALLVERDEARLEAVVDKVCRLTDEFIAAYPDDGGCDEGTTYWARAGGNLFTLLDMLEAIPGRGGRLALPKVKEIARFPARVHIAGPWFVNFADGSPRPPLPGPLVWRFGKAVGDDAVRGLGAVLTRASYEADPAMADSAWQTIAALFDVEEILADAAEPVAMRDVWLPDIEVMCARERPDHTGWFVAAKGGHNDEVHNHNDVGNFVLFLDGSPVAVDAGVGAYTKDTFSERRYTIWTMQSGWHNVPVVHGVEQKNGRKYEARSVEWRSDDAAAVLAADIGAAYPHDTGIQSWQRRVELDRVESCVRIEDSWSIADDGEVELMLLTPAAVESTSPGLVVLKTGAGRVVVRTSPALDVSTESAPEDGYVIGVSWSEGLTRVRFSGDVVRRVGSVVMTIEREKS